MNAMNLISTIANRRQVRQVSRVMVIEHFGPGQGQRN